MFVTLVLLLPVVAGLSPTYVTLTSPSRDGRSPKLLADRVPAILRLENPEVTGPASAAATFVPQTFVVYHSPGTKPSVLYDENFLSREPYYQAEYGQFCAGAPNVGVPRADGTWRGLLAETRQALNDTSEGTVAFGALGTSRHLFCAAWCRSPGSVGECSAGSPRTRARMVARCRCPRDLSRAARGSRWLAIAQLHDLGVLKGRADPSVLGWYLQAPFAAEIRGSDPREPGSTSFFGFMPREFVGQRVRWYMGREGPHVNMSGTAVFEAVPEAVPVAAALNGRYRHDREAGAWISHSGSTPSVPSDPSPSYFWCQFATSRAVEIVWFVVGFVHGLIACCALYQMIKCCKNHWPQARPVKRAAPAADSPVRSARVKPRRTAVGQVLKAVDPNDSDENDFFSD